MHNVHGAEVSLESWVMGNSSVKDPVKLCTSSSVMSGYSVLADTAISIYSTLKSGSSSYTHHSGVAMVHLLIVGRCTHAYNRSYYSQHLSCSLRDRCSKLGLSDGRAE